MNKTKGAKKVTYDPSGSALLSLHEASQRLGVSRAFVRQQLLQHKLDVVRFGRLLRIPTETLDQIVKICRRPFAPHVPGGGR